MDEIPHDLLVAFPLVLENKGPSDHQIRGVAVKYNGDVLYS